MGFLFLTGSIITGLSLEGVAAMATGASKQQTGRAGEFFVAAELNRRGSFISSRSYNPLSINPSAVNAYASLISANAN
jgi:hypothetical protein